MIAVTDYFPAAAAIVLEAEGVFSDDASDPGGETVYGIARKSHPNLSPWPPTKDQAIAIYRADYWDAHRCGEMPWQFALAVFDGEINQGSVIKALQTALALRADGVVGEATLHSMTYASAEESLNLFFAARAMAYIALPGFPIYGKGWLKRLMNVRGQAAITPAV